MIQASELFSICSELAAGQPSVEAQRRLHEVLTLACAYGTRGKGAFGNLFAQVDYLCKQRGLSTDDKVAIQTARRHLNQTQTLAREEWLYDLRALVRFVSAVFGQAVPGQLLGLLPATNRPRPQGMSIDKRCVRCIVRSWDGATIEADTDEGTISADYGSTEGGRDLGYLQKVLRPGMQLNLLDCHVEGDRVRPLVVVVEPDFLVDISSVAACFTPYGHHPLLYTVNRLKPRPNTQAILLGNFAGTALDEIVSRGGGPRTLATSLARSFREQALRFCACQDFSAERFKREAALQVANISEAFPGSAGEDYLLEPSFVCERLGLQGRVDLMTTDMRLLVEQKSGKNMKIERQSHDPHGLQLESHYVQLLLYYCIQRYNFGRTDQTVDIKLLYSHYPAAQGLLTVNYYRTLLREAIRLRNQIVATELLIAREGFGRVLPLLSPAVIYKEVKPDGYFTQYVLPELLWLQARLSALSPVERAYFERMMTFVYREQLYQKLGSADTRLYHSGGAASDLWLMPLAEKIATGNIVAGLRIEQVGKTDHQGGYDLITLSLQPCPVLNFRRGDMVYLYAYRGEPDVRASILYKGTLQDIGASRLVVRLNDGQQNRRVFDPGQQWAVEHGGSDLMTSSNLRSLCQWATAQPRRRQLLLGLRPPEADTSLALSRSYSAAYDDILLRVRQARDYFLLVGPPGTGKTSQALRHIVSEQQSDLLLMSYTNRAVDEICAMLSDEGFSYLRIGNEAACDPRFRSHLVEACGATTVQQMQQIIDATPIIVGTTSTLSSRQEIFALKHFQLAIVDEASQILEPNLVGLLSSDRIDRFVLIGDYKQLPAVVQQGEDDACVSEQCLRDLGLTDCRQSLFERLIRWEQHEHRTQFIGTLSHQGRMHPDVALFPSTHFYAREHLQPVPLRHQQEVGMLYDLPARDSFDNLLKSRRVLFLPVHEGQQGVWSLLLARLHRFAPGQSIGIIVTYRNQIAQIQQEIEQLGIPQLLDISIDTVERYQGSQRDVIIYDFGIAHRYQLSFLTANTFMEDGRPIDRKLNVAMTRARRQLILMGSPDLLRHVPLLAEIIRQYGVEA